MKRLLLTAIATATVFSVGCSCDPGSTADDDAGPDIDIDAGPGGDIDGGETMDGALPVPDGGPGVVLTEDGGFMWTCRPTSCGGRFTECGDCADNDADGLTDSRDRECLGPCDNTEGPALLAGVGGETGGPCRADCYFDFGNGSGNDDCFWDHRCDPLAVGPDFPPEGAACQYEAAREGTRDCPAEQSATCHDVCRPLTPAGCDCFGCCTFPEIADRPASEGGPHVWLGSVQDGTNIGTCTFDVITDTALCNPCTPVEGECYNDCGRCELCIGRTEIPADCFPPDGGGVPLDGGGTPLDGGVDVRCEGGEAYCGLPGEPECPIDTYCVSGCCQPTLI